MLQILSLWDWKALPVDSHHKHWLCSWHILQHYFGYFFNFACFNLLWHAGYYFLGQLAQDYVSMTKKCLLRYKIGGGINCTLLSSNKGITGLIIWMVAAGVTCIKWGLYSKRHHELFYRTFNLGSMLPFVGQNSEEGSGREQVLTCLTKGATCHNSHQKPGAEC